MSTPSPIPNPSSSPSNDPVPSHSHIERSRLLRAERLSFPPLYVLVGVYRLFTDKNLYVPTWQKCKHGFVRGAVVGLSWAVVSFNVQRAFVEVFLKNSPRVTGLSHDKLFGFQLPFSITTYATLLLLSSQCSNIIAFFLFKNLRIARDRAWDYTLLSRGKSPDFWRPYIEEFARPPLSLPSRNTSGGGVVVVWDKVTGSWAGRFFVRRVLLLPLNFYPFIGIAIGAYLKAIGTARYLHKRYFTSKKMTPIQIAIFMEERKWDYRSFGFTASLLESLPILGLVFSISNRVGAAMWAHDLEKRQHEFASGALHPIIPARPHSAPIRSSNLKSMAGGWADLDDRSSLFEGNVIA